MKDTIFKALIVKEGEGKKIIREVTGKRIDELPEGDVLIRVLYSSLNYKDALSATGHRGVTRNYPHTPGVDASGVVAESSSPQFKEGEEVLVTGYDLGMNTSGGFGEYIRVPASWVLKLPATLTLHESMVYGTAGFTAALSLYKLMAAGVEPDHGEILVTGATGGVGSVAVALLANAGFNVTAATGKPDQRDFLMKLGANRVIARDEIKDTTGRPLLKGRWAGVIDTVGGEYLEAAIKSTKPKGAVACCGLVDSPNLSLTVYPFILRGVQLIGIDSAETPMELRLKIWDQIANPWKLHPDIFDMLVSETGLENLEEKIQLILKGKIKGRVVVTIGSSRE
ncbi:MAG: YhdH/YhfP family quinone oxidoreductase [bacterium]|nr:YhdH/YhfP family quinone oxidoreductase [bacterium]